MTIAAKHLTILQRWFAAQAVWDAVVILESARKQFGRAFLAATAATFPSLLSDLCGKFLAGH
ncbi:MAG TPA: hypothetical protein VF443_10295 [Nitrospira sp.]